MVRVAPQLETLVRNLRIQKPRAAFYERVSTDEQSERDTIRAQDKALHKAYDWHFTEESSEPWEYVGTFADDGYSGTLPWDQRPHGSRMMAMLRRGEVDIVCVARSDRLARDRTIANGIAEEFSARDIAIASTVEHIDLTTPAGRLHFAILCDFSHYERELIRDRTMGGRKTHAEAGEFINGPVPFGYDIAREGNACRLVRSEREVAQLWVADGSRHMTEAELVIEVFERCRKGASVLAIMRWLRAAGVPSIKRYYNKKTERFKELTWPLWQHSRLLDMLDNEMYCGTRVLKYNKAGSTKFKRIPEPVAQSIPALITRQVFDEAKAARQQHISNFNTDREENYVYLLTSKLVCGSCGLNMIGNYRKGNRYHPTPHMVYACSRAKGRTNARRTGVPCPAPVYVSGEKLEQFVIDEIDKIRNNPSQIMAALHAQQVERHGSFGLHEARKKALRQRLANLERGRSNLLGQVSDGEIDREEFRVLSADNADKTAEVRRELEVLENEESLAEVLLAQMRSAEVKLSDLTETWDSVKVGPRKELRAYIQDLVQRVTVTKEREIHMTVLFDQRPTDKAYLCDFISIGRPAVQFFGSLIPSAWDACART